MTKTEALLEEIDARITEIQRLKDDLNKSLNRLYTAKLELQEGVNKPAPKSHYQELIDEPEFDLPTQTDDYGQKWYGY